MTEAAALIWCPFGDEESAKFAVTALLDERLIACANLFPGMQSLFMWQGQRGENPECGALIKTTSVRLDAALLRLRTLHPYDTPAITSWAVHADPATMAWLEEETRAI